MTQVEVKKRQNKYKDVVTLKEAYKKYKNEIPEGTFFDVDYKAYRVICESFNKAIIDKVINKSHEFIIPYRLGSIRIKKTKMNYSDKKHLKVDWKTTHATGIRVFHLNDHSNDCFIQWYWEKKHAIVKGQRVYSFIATRTNKRLASRLFIDKKVDYFE